MNPRLELWAVLGSVAALCVLVTSLVKEEERARGLAFLLAWLVPGAGHVFLGKWKKGLFLFALLGATYLLGLWIVGPRAVSFDDNPFYYVGQYGSGATFFLGRALGEEKAYPREPLQPSWFDPGLLYICVVGLLNLVLMMNVLDVKRPSAVAAVGDKAAPPVPPGADPAKTPPASPPPPAAAPEAKA